MNLDKIDIEILKENYDDEILEQVDRKNAQIIYKYLLDNGIYYAKDLLLGALDLFLIDYKDFIKGFEKLKKDLGKDYIDIISNDLSLLYKIQ